jgi:hypothetical protein
MTGPRCPRLRAELLTRAARAQAARYGIDPGHPSPTEVERIHAVDEENTRWLAELLAVGDWPTWRMVGVDGAHAAFLLAKRAPAAQRAAWLPQALDAVQTRDVSRRDIRRLVAMTYSEAEVGAPSPSETLAGWFEAD